MKVSLFVSLEWHVFVRIVNIFYHLCSFATPHIHENYLKPRSRFTLQIAASACCCFTLQIAASECCCFTLQIAASACCCFTLQIAASECCCFTLQIAATACFFLPYK